MSDPNSVRDSDEVSPEAGALVRLTDQPPTVLPTIVQNELVPFPGPVIPLLLENELRQDTIRQAKANSGFFLLINRASSTRHGSATSPPMGMPFMAEVDPMEDETYTQEELEERLEEHDPMDDVGIGVPFGQGSVSPAIDLSDMLGEDASRSMEDLSPKSIRELCPVGILARVVKVFRLPDGRMSALIHMMQRAQPLELLENEAVPTTRVVYTNDVITDEEKFQATYRQVRLTLQQFFEAHPSISEDVKITALSIEVPGILSDFVAQHLSRDFKERLGFLVQLDLTQRMMLALEVCIRELEMLTVGNRISQEIREKVEKHQRDFLLREQLKAIRVELGEERDPTTIAIEELKAKLDKAGLPEMARQRADE